MNHETRPFLFTQGRTNPESKRLEAFEISTTNIPAVERPVKDGEALFEDYECFGTTIGFGVITGALDNQMKGTI